MSSWCHFKDGCDSAGFWLSQTHEGVLSCKWLKISVLWNPRANAACKTKCFKCLQGHQLREAAGGAPADELLFAWCPPHSCTERFPKVKVLLASQSPQPPQKWKEREEKKREALVKLCLDKKKLTTPWCNVSSPDSNSFNVFNWLTSVSLTTSMNKTSILRFTISRSAILSVAQMAGNNPRWASCRQCSFFLWETFARTLRTWEEHRHVWGWHKWVKT